MPWYSGMWNIRIRAQVSHFSTYAHLGTWDVPREGEVSVSFNLDAWQTCRFLGPRKSYEKRIFHRIPSHVFGSFEGFQLGVNVLVQCYTDTIYDFSVWLMACCRMFFLPFNGENLGLKAKYVHTTSSLLLFRLQLKCYFNVFSTFLLMGSLLPACLSLQRNDAWTRTCSRA